MNKEKKEKTQNIYVQIVKDFVKENAIILSLMLLAFVSVSVLNFVKISTTQTVASFDLDGFEIDQIADRTIIANKTLPADENNATSVQEGEKIIKKGDAEHLLSLCFTVQATAFSWRRILLGR